MALTEADLQKIVRLAQLQTYDTKIKEFLAAADAKVLADAKAYVGTIPADSEATDVVTYLQSLITAAEYDDTTLSGLVSENAAAIATLNGGEDKAGSVAKAVKDAINTFATEISDDGTVNSFKELVDWVAVHGPEAAEFAAAIGKKEVKGEDGTVIQAASGFYAAIDAINKTLAGLTGGEEGSLGALAFKDTISDEDIADDAAIAQSKIDGLENALSSKVEIEEGKGLSTNDYNNTAKAAVDSLATTYEAIGTASTLVGTLPEKVGETDIATVVDYVDAKTAAVADSLEYATIADIDKLFE